MNKSLQHAATWIDLLEVIFNFFYVYLFLKDTERQRTSRGGAEREGDTESKAGSRLWAVSTEPDAGLKLTDNVIMTWAEVGRLTEWATLALLELLYSCWVLGHKKV